MIRVTYTHKAWFGICPVYVGNLSSEAPNLTPRWGWCDPLLVITGVVCDLADAVLGFFGRQLVVAFILVEELDEPVVGHYDEEAESLPVERR